MKHFRKYFFRGLFTFVPIGISLYLLFLFVAYCESLTEQILRSFYKGHYVPGMGIVLAVVAIYLLGLLLSSPPIKAIFSAIEIPFRNVPLVKSIYTAIEDLISYFDPSKKKSQGQVVVIRMPGHKMELVGFLTREDLGDLPSPLAGEDKVAVYLPLSYQIGGYTVFVPRSWVEKLDLPVEVAMKSTLTAWMHAE